MVITTRTVGEVAASPWSDRHRHVILTVEVSQQLVSQESRRHALAEPTEAEVPVDAKLHTSLATPVWNRSRRALVPHDRVLPSHRATYRGG